MISKEKLCALLEYGIYAPSADNLQPWQFKIGEDLVDIYIDTRYTANFCDEGLWIPYLSVGAVIENIRIAALKFGCKFSASIFPDSKNPLWAVRLRFQETQAEESKYFPVIKKRLTNRKFYQTGKELPDSAYDALHQSIRHNHGYRLLMFKKNSAEYQKLTRIIGDSDQLRFETKRLHEELIRVLRFPSKSAMSANDGLPVSALEAGPGSQYMFKLMSSWQRMSALNRLGMSKLFNLYARLQMNSSQAAGVIVSTQANPVTYLKGGVAMQKLWLEATLQGLALQPMEALPIFVLNLQLNKTQDFTENQVKKLKTLKEEFYSLFGLGADHAVIFMFRIGYGTTASARTTRRSLESFLI